MDLDYLIEYESENTCLDFKVEEYVNNKISLLKDIMSMANADSMDKKYIIIGVKDLPDSERQIIGLDSISDQANLENVIQENIEPNINFKYYKYFYKEKLLGIIEIANNANPPYMMKKDMGALKKGEIWVRKGSRQSRAVREDIDRMFFFRNNTLDSQKIKLGFGDDLDSEQTITIPKINAEEIPSNIEITRLKELLERLKQFENEEITDENSSNMYNIFPEYKSDTKEITVGTTEFGIPVYYNEEKLLDKIEKAPDEFIEEDCYFFSEENSIKLNFSILNNTNAFLEDVKIQFKIDSKVFMIAEKLPEKLRHQDSLLRIPTVFQYGYPDVEKKDDHYLITDTFDKIRHKELIKIFTKDLRCIFIGENIEQQTEIKYELSSRNLPSPIKGKLTLKWR